MSDIKFGLKLWSKNYNLVSQAQELIKQDVFQYVELMVLPGDDISIFENAAIPYILHIPHNDFGFNIGEEKTLDFSKEILNQNIKMADRLSAKYLILHPGFGQMAVAGKFLQNMQDNRILIENMPKTGSNGETMIGFDLKQLKELMQDKFGFCLDFEHATKAALSMETDHRQFIKELLGLGPKVFHICDGTLLKGPDMHLSIGEGEYDFNFFAECIKGGGSKYVTLETARRNLNSLDEDIKNLEKIKKFL